MYTSRHLQGLYFRAVQQAGGSATENLVPFLTLVDAIRNKIGCRMFRNQTCSICKAQSKFIINYLYVMLKLHHTKINKQICGCRLLHATYSEE